MPPHDVTKTGLRDISQQYGDTMHYTYGCPQGECRMYVYKIVIANEDGVAWELPWPDVKRRCGELGLAHVPELLGRPVANDGTTQEVWLAKLKEMVESLTEGASALSPAQIREGVVIRTESKQGISHIKNKSFAFKVLEGIIKEQETYVDPEEAA